MSAPNVFNFERLNFASLEGQWRKPSRDFEFYLSTAAEYEALRAVILDRLEQRYPTLLKPNESVRFISVRERSALTRGQADQRRRGGRGVYFIDPNSHLLELLTSA